MKLCSIVIFILFVLGCKRNSSINAISQKADTVLRHASMEEDWEAKITKRRDTNYQYLNRLLNQVLATIEPHKQDDSFMGQIDTSVYQFKNMEAVFQFGHIFATDKKHLIVKRFINEYESARGSLFTDIYLLQNNHFKKVVADTANIGYYEDTLTDINLDGYKDFVISQYSGAGCCPRDDKIAYLYNAANGAFAPIGLFNVEFDNANKLIYEMDYGHPGEVTIEKSKWVGLSKIKIESICPTHVEDKIDSFVKPYSFTKIIYPSEKQFILKAVPKEYNKLEVLPYFLSYQ